MEQGNQFVEHFKQKGARISQLLLMRSPRGGEVIVTDSQPVSIPKGAFCITGKKSQLDVIALSPQFNFNHPAKRQTSSVLQNNRQLQTLLQSILGKGSVLFFLPLQKTLLRDLYIMYFRCIKGIKYCKPKQWKIA